MVRLITLLIALVIIIVTILVLQTEEIVKGTIVEKNIAFCLKHKCGCVK